MSDVAARALGAILVFASFVLIAGGDGLRAPLALFPIGTGLLWFGWKPGALAKRSLLSVALWVGGLSLVLGARVLNDAVAHGAVFGKGDFFPALVVSAVGFMTIGLKATEPPPGRSLTWIAAGLGEIVLGVAFAIASLTSTP